MKSVLSILLVGILVFSGFGAAITTNVQSNYLSMSQEIHFSDPVITTSDDYLSVQIDTATSYATSPGNPVLPIYTKLYSFPFGTIIKDVSFTASVVQRTGLAKEILPAKQPTPLTDASNQPSEKKLVKNDAIYSNAGTYPSSRLTYTVGAGLDGNDRVVLLSVQYYPLLYVPQQQLILFTPDVELKVTYEHAKNPLSLPKSNSLLIIAPEEFTTALQPLIQHKNFYSIETTLISTEWIATYSAGRDLPEKIKYAIKDAIETNGTSFVLLVGGVDQIPIRRSYTKLWNMDENLITDMYYSDIYDASGNFSSWDANHNNRFGESGDRIDLYPDVHLGRLACTSVEDVNITVDKIIHYETETYGSNWFNTMIFMGGNTFPGFHGNDGEENNQIIIGIMSQFTPVIIWTSKGNFNRRTISNAITNGAGFLDYSGHGFEHGIMTYTPSGLARKYYFTPYIKDLKNGYKLPIMFFDACLTSKIDFVLQDFLDYKQYRVFDVLAKVLKINTSVRLPVFSWAFVIHEGGGAIATIGATRTAYGGVDSGAGKMSIEFFSAYNTSQYLGEMITQMQNSYITDVHEETFTVQEFILLGDPTLRMGGYPPR